MVTKLGTVEISVLKALERNEQATVAEIAAMLPSDGIAEVDKARAALLKNDLVELVPGSASGALRLTNRGVALAKNSPEDPPAGSGGGDAKYN